jgi:hypothetical protein
MAVDATAYFRGLISYLNKQTYEVTARDSGRIVLEEKFYLADGKESSEKVRLGFSGDVMVIRLDTKPIKKGDDYRLFHFLDNEAKPWSKRCDFVIFHLIDNRINIHCIEFKSASIPDSVVDQLKASESWCKSLHEIISIYTGQKKRMHLKKYVFTCVDDPGKYLDDNAYLKRDHTIRHYHYDDLKSCSLEMLENECPVIIG